MVNFLGNCLTFQIDNAVTNIKPTTASSQSLKNGKYMCGPSGLPGIMSNVKMSKTGKHGHAKFTYNLYHPFTGQTVQEMYPGHTHLKKPEMIKQEWMVQHVDVDGTITCMDGEDKNIDCFMATNFVDKDGKTIGQEFHEQWAKFENGEIENQDLWVSVLIGPVEIKKGVVIMVRQITGWQFK